MTEKTSSKPRKVVAIHGIGKVEAAIVGDVVEVDNGERYVDTGSLFVLISKGVAQGKGPSGFSPEECLALSRVLEKVNEHIQTLQLQVPK